MGRPKRENTLTNALRVLDLRYMLRRDPTAQDIYQYLGMSHVKSARWAEAIKRMSEIQQEEAA